VDPSSGRSPVLLFYDFGMMGQIVPNVRERLLDVFYGIYRCVVLGASGVLFQALSAMSQTFVLAAQQHQCTVQPVCGKGMTSEHNLDT
jgi:hypothetical protein